MQRRFGHARVFGDLWPAGVNTVACQSCRAVWLLRGGVWWLWLLLGIYSLQRTSSIYETERHMSESTSESTSV